jgi:Putative zinc-finger
MSDCRICKDRMIEALYGELDRADKERFEKHLGACPDCASEYSLLGATLSLMDKRERPDPGPGFWDGYWDRLSRRRTWEEAGEAARPSLVARLVRAFSRLPRWSYQAAGAAALLLVGILIGSRVVAPPPGKTGPSVAAVAPAAPSGAVVQAENFIERSKVLLLGLVNYDPATEDAYAFDLERKRTLSRELAAEAPALRGALNERGQKRLRELVSELEVIMMQIANLGSGQEVEGIELIKQGVDNRGLFLKIDLDRMARDARGRAAKNEPLKKRI